MDYLLWAQVIGSFVTAIAESQGKDTRAIGYLKVSTSLASSVSATDAELLALKAKYDAAAAAGTPVTAEELAELKASINSLSDQIQAS